MKKKSNRNRKKAGSREPAFSIDLFMGFFKLYKKGTSPKERPFYHRLNLHKLNKSFLVE